MKALAKTGRTDPLVLRALRRAAKDDGDENVRKAAQDALNSIENENK